MHEINDLYALPPSEFTRARNELARRLEGDDAAAVKSLRKPTLALWAVNQTARRHPEGVRRLVELGDEVRSAQIEGRAGDFRAAMKERSAVLSRLLEQTREVLEEVGGAASHAERAGRTIEAAAADESERDALLAGAVRRELEPGGFGDVFEVLGDAFVPDAAATRRAEEAEAAREQARTLAEQAQAARRDASARQREAKEAEAQAAAARRAAERAAAKAEKAEADAEAAARRADDLLG
ncbi:MAG TPA: hypothetical protein VM784_07805 [Actinomycetota bacterium]|nr:hypothetical protein [Actinomycetota bacterium]